jgi:hypothetical protein
MVTFELSALLQQHHFIILKNTNPELSFCLALFQSQKNNQRHQHHFLDLDAGDYGGHGRTHIGAECI